MSQTNNTYSRIAERPYVTNVIHTNCETEWVTVYFKLVYSEDTIYYNIPIKWDMDSFINIVEEWIIKDWDLDENQVIDIIEMGQEIPGINPEDAPCLIEENITYYNKFIAKNKWPGFYIKIKNE
jgi:hypothetical protein